MQTGTITLSKTSAIIKCCAVAFMIAILVSMSGHISLHDFYNNLLDWDSF